jgi:acetyl-CoA carboxylase biotin carboxyl carrier protein
MSAQLLVDFELLAKLFKDGGWSELRVKSGDVSLLLSKDGNASLIDENERRLEAAPNAKTDSVKSVQSTTGQKLVGGSTPARGVSIDASWKAVAAPNIGTFYRSPKPGSAPFVEVGQHVTAQTEICLLEVMKLFTSVNSGIDGTVVQICATDAELVEGGQILFYIQPD